MIKLEFLLPGNIGKAFVPKKWRHKLKDYLLTAGFAEVPYNFFGVMFYIGLLFAFFFYSNPWMGISGYISEFPLISVFIATFVIWFGVMVVYAFGFMLFFKMYADLIIYQRSKSIEDVLPDFLQLTSANVRAGMSIDKAMWFAIRPRFGILAKEIEAVAKQTLSGKQLETSLDVFAKKYQSKILRRSVNLLIKGMESGGEVGNLLNKISSDIQQTKVLRKDMSASVTTYMIFITFATIFAAPALFSLSIGLLTVIKSILSEVQFPKTGTISNLAFEFSAESIAIGDFKIFAVSSIAVTAFFSAVIVSMIKKGDVRDGLKLIPAYMIGAVAVFFIASSIIVKLLSGMF